jgi:CheY-like chemotaxis protein
VKRVLVVDDDPAVARLVSAALARAEVEHQVDYCSDGGQARTKAAQEQYDLIALDLAMPFMNGVEALEEMKRNPKSAQTPVVVITALQDPALHSQVKQLGAVATVTKPFKVWDLVSIFRLVFAGDQSKSLTDAGGRPPDR